MPIEPPTVTEFRALQAELKRTQKQLQRRHTVGNMLAGYCKTVAADPRASKAWRISLYKWIKAWDALRPSRVE